MAARVLPFAAAAILVGLAGARADEAASPGTVDAAALQVLADLTLVDGACPNDVVDFGVGFRFAAANGVADETVLPGGSRRTEFEAVLRARRASFDTDELCGEIAENYAEALPGSVTLRPPTEARP